MKLTTLIKGALIGRFGGHNVFEVTVDQENGILLAYQVSEIDLIWLNANKKSKWEVKYVAISVREI